MNDNNLPSGNGHIPVRRGKVDSVDLYEVRKDELELITEGNHGALQLNFAIFLFSMAFTSFAALLVSDFSKSVAAQIVFIIVTILGCVLGSYFMFAWKQSRKPIKKVITEIKNRLNGKPAYQQNPEDVENEPPDTPDN